MQTESSAAISSTASLVALIFVALRVVVVPLGTSMELGWSKVVTLAVLALQPGRRFAPSSTS
jgi:uncharacterized membrane protein